jgi:hypothetical protein
MLIKWRADVIARLKNIEHSLPNSTSMALFATVTPVSGNRWDSSSEMKYKILCTSGPTPKISQKVMPYCLLM